MIYVYILVHNRNNCTIRCERAYNNLLCNIKGKNKYNFFVIVPKSFGEF